MTRVSKLGQIPLIKLGMGSYLVPACKVFDTMAARTFILNFVKIFYGCDSNNVWHLLVTLVCKMKLVW